MPLVFFKIQCTYQLRTAAEPRTHQLFGAINKENLWIRSNDPVKPHSWVGIEINSRKQTWEVFTNRDRLAKQVELFSVRVKFTDRAEANYKYKRSSARGEIFYGFPHSTFNAHLRIIDALLAGLREGLYGRVGIGKCRKVVSCLYFISEDFSCSFIAQEYQARFLILFEKKRNLWYTQRVLVKCELVRKSWAS